MINLAECDGSRGFWMPDSMSSLYNNKSFWRNFLEQENLRYYNISVIDDTLRKYNACIISFADNDTIPDEDFSNNAQDEQYYIQFDTAEDFLFFCVRFS